MRLNFMPPIEFGKGVEFRVQHKENARIMTLKKWAVALPYCAGAMLAGQAQAICLGASAQDSARIFFERYYGFSSASQPGIREIVTPAFLQLLEKEWACVAKAQVCAIDADPWLDAQDGEARDAWFFSEPDGLTIAVRYSFVLDTETQPRAARIRLARADHGCWRVSDLVGPEGRSLRRTLERYHQFSGLKTTQREGASK